jgi:hypothetical protein
MGLFCAIMCMACLLLAVWVPAYLMLTNQWNLGLGLLCLIGFGGSGCSFLLWSCYDYRT